MDDKWTLRDHLNTVRKVVDARGCVVSNLEYNAFGALVSATGDKPLFRYTGKMFDDATGLQWNINRWYDSNVGRWISEDPIGFRGKDGNVTRYVYNSPIQYADIYGKVAQLAPFVLGLAGSDGMLILGAGSTFTTIAGLIAAYTAPNTSIQIPESYTHQKGGMDVQVSVDPAPYVVLGKSYPIWGRPGKYVCPDWYSVSHDVSIIDDDAVFDDVAFSFSGSTDKREISELGSERKLRVTLGLDLKLTCTKIPHICVTVTSAGHSGTVCDSIFTGGVELYLKYTIEYNVGKGIMGDTSEFFALAKNAYKYIGTFTCI